MSLSITPHFDTDTIFNIEAIVLRKICDNLPSAPVSCSLPNSSNLVLADPNFAKPGAIDMLLGADLFSKILLNGHVHGSSGEPDAVNTHLGYVLMSKIEFATSSNSI